MKIGKYILAGLLMAAVILPASAQDKQYDVKLTVYPKEDQAKVKESKKAQKEREKNLRDEYREYKKAEREAKSIERAAPPAEPVKIEAAQSGKPYVSTRPVEGEAPAVGEGKNPADANAVVYPYEPVKIESAYPEKPKQPVRPMESYDPVAAPACDKGECCGKCEKGECTGECGKPCCGDKACDKPGKGHGKPAMGPTCQMTPCGMPIFGCNAQYRDFKKMMRANMPPCEFYGSAFYVGTNALAYLILAPNANIEWRRDEKLGLRLSVGGFYWPWTDNDNNENTYGFWVTPEVRFYLGKKKAWYAGPMVQYSYLGRCYDSYYYYGGGSPDRVNEHYMAISAGGTFGYMQKIKRNFAIDYNIGMGVSAVGHYDGYYAGATTDWKPGFSLTNIGISLVWQTCKKPLKQK